MAEKMEQLLIVEPQHELRFPGPFNQPVISHMRLTNPTSMRILFKIKTTAPKKYCVRPNCGTLEPKETVEIAICLQPFTFDPNEKNKHKFMVQGMIAPDAELTSTLIDQLWKEVTPEQLMDSKLRCVFDVPENTPVKVNANQLTAQGIDESGKQDTFRSSSAEEKNPVCCQAAEEVKLLRVEESSLRKLNIQLKEQLLRLQIAMDESNLNQDRGTGTYRTTFSTPMSGMQLQQKPIPPLAIYISIALAILGILIGKFLL